MNKNVSVPMVVIFALTLIAGVACLALGQVEAGMLLLGTSAGLLGPSPIRSSR